MKKFNMFLVLLFALWILAIPEIGQAQQSVCRQQGSRQVTLRTSAALTATANGSTIGQLQDCKEAMLILDVTTASLGTDDALNVYLQTTPDGTNYTDVVAFTQVVGSTVQRIARWTSRTVPTDPEGALEAAALTAGTVEQGPAGRLWRVRSVVSDSGTTGNSSWTYSVVGYFRD